MGSKDLYTVQYVILWYDTVGYTLVWNRWVHFGMVQMGTFWYGTVSYIVLWYSRVLCGMVQLGTFLYGTAYILVCTVQCSTVQYFL